MKNESMIIRKDIHSFLPWIEECLRRGEKIELTYDEEFYLNNKSNYTRCELNLKNIMTYKLYYNLNEQPKEGEVSTIHRIRRIAVIVYVDRMKQQSYITGMKKKYIIPQKTEEVILYQGDI